MDEREIQIDQNKSLQSTELVRAGPERAATQLGALLEANVVRGSIIPPR